ncbi:hypothetical protein [Alteromonas sp. a30]|uniref:hypothetical protein n=1 Tax=Alteromonas sp. a30 TaxID=2730917 RepID=UPI002280DB97|nr:hypothetical protein [Alteromonas sp. a30]MCY7297365.1 hypothetical protein [Alteromonas sp. a30]
MAEDSEPDQISFMLFPGSLESNVMKLLEQHSSYQLLLWHVSKKYQVVVPAKVMGRDVFHILDQMISPYTLPKNVMVSVFTKNKVVRVHYPQRNEKF